MDRLTVLITNKKLAARTGTEMWVLDFARELQQRGHRPVVYTPQPGLIADELTRLTIPVVDDPTKLSVVPDVIHGHHTVSTLVALLTFPQTPAVFLIHDWAAWHDRPLPLPRIRRIVPVDHTCADRALAAGFRDDQVEVVLNFVDLARFIRRNPLPDKPQRAVVFDNGANPDNHGRHIVAACRAASIPLDFIGAMAGRTAASPESVLPDYDLVFAKAKAAMEAMATGCATILFNENGVGGLVTSDRFDAMRRLNFGRRLMTGPMSEAGFAAHIAAYSAADAGAVCDRIRAEASLGDTADQMLALYRTVIEEHAAADHEAERKAEYAVLSGLLREIDGDMKLWSRMREGRIAATKRRVRGWFQRYSLIGFIRTALRRTFTFGRRRRR